MTTGWIYINATSISATNHATGADPAVPGRGAAAADAAASDLTRFSECWIPGASRLPLAWSATARGASPGLRTIPPCSCLLMRPRAGPVLRRQLDWRELHRRWLRLRRREPNKTPRSMIRGTTGGRRATSVAQPRQTQAPSPSPDRYPEQIPEPSAPEPSAKVIEFPRSAAIPVFRASELADPVFDYDRPRIVEVAGNSSAAPRIGRNADRARPARAGR